MAWAITNLESKYLTGTSSWEYSFDIKKAITFKTEEIAIKQLDLFEKIVQVPDKR